MHIYILPDQDRLTSFMTEKSHADPISGKVNNVNMEFAQLAELFRRSYIASVMEQTAPT